MPDTRNGYKLTYFENNRKVTRWVYVEDADALDKILVNIFADGMVVCSPGRTT